MNRRIQISFVVGMTVTVFAFLFLPLIPQCRPVLKPADEERIQRWEDTRPDNVLSIVLHPLRKGRVTIGRSVTITNRATIRRVYEHLRSEQTFHDFLVGYEHWGAIHCIMLELQVADAKGIIWFFVDWFFDRPVCSFGLMRDSKSAALGMSSGNYLLIGADDQLPGLLADVFRSNGVSWVSRFMGEWREAQPPYDAQQ